MKRKTTISIFILLIAVLTSAAMVFNTSKAASSGPKAFVSGGGQTSFNEHFTFSAHDGPNGPKGYVTFKAEYSTLQPPSPNPDFEVQGHVVCMETFGNQATIVIRIEKGERLGVDLAGRFFRFFVLDGGEPSQGGPPVDFIANNIVFNDAPPCDPRATPPPKPVVRGNIVVRQETR